MLHAALIVRATRTGVVKHDLPWSWEEGQWNFWKILTTFHREKDSLCLRTFKGQYLSHYFSSPYRHSKPASKEFHGVPSNFAHNRLCICCTLYILQVDVHSNTELLLLRKPWSSFSSTGIQKVRTRTVVYRRTTFFASEFRDLDSNFLI